MRKFYLFPLFLSFVLTTNATLPDNAIYFTGNGDRVLITHPLGTNTDEFTFETWIKSDLEASCGGGKHMRIISHSGNLFEVAECGGQIRLYMNRTWYNTNSDIRDDQWHHLAIVKSPSEVTVYVDGYIVRTIAFSNSINFSGNISIGGYFSGGRESFQGKMDEVKLWSEARDSVSIRKHMFRKMTGVESNLEIYLKFDQNSNGNTVTNNAGTDGTMSTGTGGSEASYQLANRKFARSIELNGNYAQFDYPLTSNSDYTIEFAFKKSPGGTGTYPRVIGSSQSHLEISQREDGSFHWYIGVWRSMGFSVTDNKWHHFAITRQGNEHKVYLDGIEKYSFSSARVYNFTNKYFIIGGVNEGWKGNLDEFRIWDVALDATTITENICEPQSANSTNLASYYNMDQIGASYLLDLTSGERDGIRRDINMISAPSFADDAALPLADFVLDRNSCTNQVSSFTNTLADDQAIWQWDINADQSIEGTNANYFSTSFSTAGNHTVALYLETSLGCKDSYEYTFETFTTPVAQLTTATTVCLNDTISMDNQSNLQNTRNPTWRWDYNGDGLEDYVGVDSMDFTYLYTQLGTHQANYIVASQGCEDTVQMNIRVDDAPIASFQVNDNCFGLPSTFVSTSSVYSSTASYSWDFQTDNTPDVIDNDTDSPLSPQFTYPSIGIYIASLTVNNHCGTSTLVDSFVQIYAAVIPVISDDNGLLTSTEADDYQWYLDSEEIDNATDQTYTPTQSGTYYVCTTDDNGCQACSESITVTTTSTDDIYSNNTFSIFPNPTNSKLQLDFKGKELPIKAEIRVYGLLGKLLLSQPFNKPELDVSGLVTGTYFFQLKDQNSTYTLKFQKQ